jgi:endoglucanase
MPFRLLSTKYYAQVIRTSAATAILLGSLLGPTAPATFAAAGLSVTSRASVSPGRVMPGHSVKTTAAFTSATTARDVTVDIEVRNASGKMVLQQSFSRQSFAARKTRAFTANWAVPSDQASGTYTVMTGAFSADWATNYGWNPDAARITVAAATPAPAPVPASVPKSFGVNFAGAEFNDARRHGTVYTDYIYPNDRAEAAYFAGKGQTLIRVPVLWERLQPTAFGPLSQPDVDGLRAVLDSAQAAGQRVIVDLHNYGRYDGVALTTADAPKLNDAWRKIAGAVHDHPALYGYELMNEPHDLPEGSASWAVLAQSATSAIRQVDTQAYVLVPGYAWQGAWSWPDNNANLLVDDPSNKVVYAAHQYFDRNGSGTYGSSYDADGAYPTIGSDRARPFLDWLASKGVRGMFTEYGVPDTDLRWLTVLDTFLATLDSTATIMGGTYWAAGPWWGDYPLAVEPRNGIDRPQMSVLTKHPSHA